MQFWHILQAYHFQVSKDVRLVCNGYYPEIFIINPNSLEILYTLSSKVAPDWISACCILHPVTKEGRSVCKGIVTWKCLREHFLLSLPLFSSL